MRCVSCDRLLSSFEASRKGPQSGKYLDLCNKCCSDADIYSQDEPYIPAIEDEEQMGDGIFNISDFDLLTSTNED